MISMAQAVRNGVKLLYEKDGKWKRKLRGKSIKIESDRECILGNLYGDYISGCDALNIIPGCWRSQEKECSSYYGFTYSGRSETSIPRFNRLWRKAINERSKRSN